MGKRGPAPKPSALKLVENTYRSDRAAPNEVEFAEGLPPAPEFLGPRAQREWGRIVGELEKVPGLLQQTDMAALAAYCSTFATFAHCEEILRDGGLTTTVTMKNGTERQVARDEVRIRSDAWAKLRQFAAEFGFTPSARSRVSAPRQPKGDDGLLGKYTG